jgi:predicted metalloprotease with PDZ domain
MSTRHRHLGGALLAAATLAILPAHAQTSTARTAADSQSAPISNVVYDVTFDRRNAPTRTIAVRMTFSTDGSAPVLLSLPAWTPGAYEITNFARWVVGFSAASGTTAVPWDKLDFDTWRIRPGNARQISISFTFSADTLDNAIAWARPNFLLFNGTNIFMYPEGRPANFAATVAIHTESDWRIATGMTATGPTTFTSSNYDDLVDMPFFVGDFDIDSVSVAGKWVRFASYPRGSVTSSRRSTVLAQLSRVIPPEIAVFGEAPWANYTVMQIVDTSYAGASGLEHQSSHVDILAPSFVGAPFQPSLYAHEIFHSWNVKRLRPAEMWPYDYSHAQPTPWLWVSEGITDYYADLAEVRGGVIEDTGFYKLTADKINEVNGLIPVALEDASLNTWIHPIDGTEYIYYPKGSLAGLMLDIMIRDASDNARSLDTVMRELYQTAYKRNRGFTSDDWWGAVSRAAGGVSFADFQARYVDGRESYPWAEILPKAGLRGVSERVPRMGIFSQQSPAGITVTSVEPGGSADQAGVRPGDMLMSVGNIPVEDQDFGARFRAKYGAAPEGTPLAIVVTRAGQRVTLNGKVMFAPGQMRIEADPSASPKATRIREGLLRGK